MSGNTFGQLFAVTNFGESHGPAIGCVIDGCPPGMDLTEADIQHDLDRRRPGTSRHVTQRNEPDAVEILSGVYEGKTTGTPICLLIKNTDQRSKDYGNILDTFRPGHADYTYLHKYGLRDPRGGGPLRMAGIQIREWIPVAGVSRGAQRFRQFHLRTLPKKRADATRFESRTGRRVQRLRCRKRRPRRHQRTPAFEEVSPVIRGFRLVSEGVRQRGFAHGPRDIRALGRPVPKA